MVRRRRFGRVSIPGFLAIIGLAGTAMALVLVAIAAWPNPDVDAYRRAQACTAPVLACTRSCFVVAPATVTGVRHEYHRGGGHYFYSLAGLGAPYVTRVDAAFLAIPTFRESERVQAEIWNGRVTRLSGHGDVFVTTQSPSERGFDLRRAAAYLTFAAWLPFLLAVLDALWRARGWGRVTMRRRSA